MNYESYKNLIKAGTDSVAYISDVNTYEMLYMTEKAQELFGVNGPEEYRCRKCYDLLHGAKRPCTFCNNERLSDTPFSWVQYNERLGEWVYVSDYLAQHNGRACRIEHTHEISKDQPWSREMTENIKSETVILQCIQALSAETDYDRTIEDFLDMVGHFYRADRSYIIEFYPEKGTLSNTHEWCEVGIESAKELLQDVPLEVVDEWVERFHRDGEFRIGSVSGEMEPNAEDKRLLEMQGISALLAIPIYDKNDIIGFIGVDNPESNLSRISILRVTADFIFVELDRRRVLEDLRRRGFRDDMTGVFNRNSYIQTKEYFYNNTPKTFGVIVIDINGLKEINDSLGHAYGDEVIITTANILCSEQKDRVFRAGGDEFIILCPDRTRQQVLDTVMRLREAFAREKSFSVSVGCSWTDKPSDIKNHVHMADEAMYSEKQRFYRNLLSSGVEVRDVSANEVLHEIDEGRYIVHYQPQVDMRTGKIVGVESLVRKLAEDGSIISPGRFVPILEAQNVLMHVDMFVLETVLKLQRKLQDEGIFVPMSVNFSRNTLLLLDFVKILGEAFKECGVDTKWVTLEVTETISTIDRPQLLEILRELRNMGIRISLDDFGTQYSNMAILADIPFEEVKFDKTLVDDIVKNPRSRTIVKKMVEMCRDLQEVEIVAEGVETTEQAQRLQKYSVNCAQGYLFHRPMPAEQLTELLRKTPTGRK